MLIGIESLYYAKMTDEDAETYAVPVEIPGINTIEITPSTGNAEYYADNGLYESLPFVSSVDLGLTLAEIAVTIRADLLGNTHAAGVVVESTSDRPPYVAIGFKTLKSNGSAVYVWYYKGKFKIPTETLETKKAETELQDLTIEGTFYGKTANDNYKKFTDEDDPNYVDVSATWFNAVV